MTKVDIISGFLGAGKTTLIKKLVKEAYKGEQVVLIENEFGEIGIDGGFLKDSGIQINEMNSGCICCSLVGDFKSSLTQVLTTYHPDRIIIEPSGVGKLSDIISAVENLGLDDVALNGFTTVVDAKKAKAYIKNFGEFYLDQIEHASCIILSHVQMVDDEKLKTVVDLIKEHNDKVTIITTDWDKLDGKAILTAMEEKDTIEIALQKLEEEHEEEHEHEHHHHHHHHDHDDHDDEHEHHHHHDHDDDDEEEHEHHHHHHHHDDEHDEHEHEHHHHHHHHHHHGEECDDPECSCHDHDADEIFESIGAETIKKFTKEEIESCLKALDSDEYGTILRAKGIVEGVDGEWIHFDYVPGEPDIRTGAAGVTGRLCVIGAEVDDDKVFELFGV